MQLAMAVKIAYEQGTNMQSKSVYRQPRFRELAVALPDRMGVSGVQQAEMIYLGERLAARAYKNLPADIRARTPYWSEMQAWQQEMLLTMLFERLTTKQWRVYRKLEGEPALPDRAETALPAMTKSWRRGPLQPNCLGLAQMLVGFAREVGAPYMLINALVRNDEVPGPFIVAQLQGLLAALEPYTNQRYVAAKYKKIMAMLQYEADRVVLLRKMRQAHHCIMIQLEDRSWVMLDPYLHCMFHFSPTIEGEEDLAALSFGRLRRDPLYLDVSYNSANLPFGHDTLKKMYEVCRRLIAVDDGELSREMLHAVRQEIPTISRGSKYDEYLESKRVDLKVLRRHLVGDVLNYTLALIDVYADGNNHVLFECVNPLYFLGVATAHHVACHSGGMDTQVLHYSSAQFLLRDALLLPHASEDPYIQERLQDCIDSLADEFLMPEIRQYNSIRKETAHAETDPESPARSGDRIA